MNSPLKLHQKEPQTSRTAELQREHYIGDWGKVCKLVMMRMRLWESDEELGEKKGSSGPQVSSSHETAAVVSDSHLFLAAQCALISSITQLLLHVCVFILYYWILHLPLLKT